MVKRMFFETGTVTAGWAEDMLRWTLGNPAMTAMTVENAANQSSSMAAAGAPAGDGRRIPSLDVLRGFALLGILAVNIQSFAMIEAAYFNPTAYGDLSGANYLVW